MIKVSKKEAEYLRKMIPGVHIRKTVHKRYAEETMNVLTLLVDNEEAKQALSDLKKFYRMNSYQYID